MSKKTAVKIFVSLLWLFLMTGAPSMTHGQQRPITTPVNVSSTAFVLSYCGLPSAISVGTFASRWHNTLRNTSTIERTMQNYFANCSYNTMRFLPQDNIVVPRVIDVPCNGTRMSGQVYDLSSKCGTSEIYAMQEYAEYYSREVLKVNISTTNKRRIMLLPRSNVCPWAGLATVGCNGPRCNTWINGYGAEDMALYFHEMNHNNGAMHSRSLTGGEYGDTTCAMGSGQSCLNAPQNWRLGWATNLPGGFINLTARAVGRWSSYDIPAQHLSNRNMLRIHPDLSPTASPNPATNFFVSYRMRALPFEQLPQRPPDVVIHAYNNTRNGTITRDRTMQLSLLRVNGTFQGFLYGKRQFVLLVQATNATHARVTLCRPNADIESLALSNCADGLDNDCNRIADAREPNCMPSQRGTTTDHDYDYADDYAYDSMFAAYSTYSTSSSYVEYPPHIDTYNDNYHSAYRYKDNDNDDNPNIVISTDKDAKAEPGQTSARRLQ